MASLRRQIEYLLSGLVFWLPIAIVGIAGRYIFGNLEGLGKGFLGLFLGAGFIYPGLGIAFWLVVFFATGLVLRKTSAGHFLSSIPILGIFFREKGEAMSLDRLLSLTPCLFLYSPTCISYGWILSEQGVRLNNEGANFTLINVYYPNVPAIVTGQVYSVRKETVIRLGNPSREIIDVLLYGLRRPENLRCLPWEDESEEGFRHRARHFGLDRSRD